MRARRMNRGESDSYTTRRCVSITRPTMNTIPKTLIASEPFGRSLTALVFLKGNSMPNFCYALTSCCLDSWKIVGKKGRLSSVCSSVCPFVHLCFALLIIYRITIISISIERDLEILKLFSWLFVWKF